MMKPLNGAHEATYALLPSSDTRTPQVETINNYNKLTLAKHKVYDVIFYIKTIILHRATAYVLLGFIILINLILWYRAHQSHLPTLFEYYTSGGIKEGLKASSAGFTLNGRPITIYSGALHYFRVHPAYWRDGLKKTRAAGLNAVETYVPWNLHEPRMGEFDFGFGENDLSILLDLRRFVKLAQEEDLFVILRPGPYICAEWEFGGLPSWLLRYDGVQVRSSDTVFTGHVRQYFNQLLPQVSDLMFQKGGPVIALQIENEYGSFSVARKEKDPAYLELLRELYHAHGINELYFTSDSPSSSKDYGALPGVLQTANFAGRADRQFETLLQLQPHKPLMAMELWSGWFDHWTEDVHETGNPAFIFAAILTSVFEYNASVNIYMFHGGSSFGFMNGANILLKHPYYAPDVSSYDYSAPVSEAGDYTEKYFLTKSLIAEDNKIMTRLPQAPPQTIKMAYPSVLVKEYIPITDLLNQVPAKERTTVTSIGPESSMEMLSIEAGNGQSYGIVVYRKVVRPEEENSTLRISGHVRDVAYVLLDGDLQTITPENKDDLKEFGFWPAKNAELTLSNLVPNKEYRLDILVENMGRVNFGAPKHFLQKKGLWEGPVLFDGEELADWDVLALQFKTAWINNLKGWRSHSARDSGPAMYRTRFTIKVTPHDTFIDMSNWTKGFVFVNGFPLGRYFFLGPQLTNFIPAPLLKTGENEILIFELYSPASYVTFSNTPKLGENRKITEEMAFYL